MPTRKNSGFIYIWNAQALFDLFSMKSNVCRYFTAVESEEAICGNQNEPASHYNDVIMGWIASQITSLEIVNSTVHSG